MPELPEVEVTRLSFARDIAGAHVLSAKLGRPLRWPLGCEPAQLVGAQVGSVGRRGKYLLIELDQGVLLLHLGMSGSLRFAAAQPPAGTHDHFELLTTQGLLRLNDPRRFGAVVFVTSLTDDPMAHKLLGKLGMEPLSDTFDASTFHAKLFQRRAVIKQVLLAGDVVVGVGNIYASESLFLAGIRPDAIANELSLAQSQRLHGAIRDVLMRAVECGGSTLRDFSSASGHAGCFQLETMVYARAQLPCRVCGTPIQMIRQGQRSTFFCPKCQTY